MRITRLVLAAVLAAVMVQSAATPAEASPRVRVATPCDFWFICC